MIFEYFVFSTVSFKIYLVGCTHMQPRQTSIVPGPAPPASGIPLLHVHAPSVQSNYAGISSRVAEVCR